MEYATLTYSAPYMISKIDKKNEPYKAQKLHSNYVPHPTFYFTDCC